MEDLNNAMGCAMSLLSGQEARDQQGETLSPQSEADLLTLARQIDQLLNNGEVKTEVQVAKLAHYQRTLEAIAPFGSRYISNRYDNYFIVQCEFDFDQLEDALEHDTLDDMYDSMSIAHDIERDKFEASAIIVREIDGNVQACDLRGCWNPLADKFAVTVENWLDTYTI